MFDFEKLAAEVSAVISAVTPVVDVLAPGASKIVNIAAGVLKAAVAGEHDAVALVNQIKSGVPLTADQMHALDAAYDDAEARLESDAAAADAAG